MPTKNLTDVKFHCEFVLWKSVFIDSDKLILIQVLL